MMLGWSRFRSLSAGLSLLVGGSAVVIGVGIAPAEALPLNCTQAGQTVTCTYASTGAEQTFVVPTGVTSAQVTAVGGAGGSSNAGLGAQAASVSGVLTGLTGGSTLYVEVAGNGAQGSDANAGGFNGGGSGPGGAGGGGGGASDVRTSSRVSANSLTSRLIVAAGGGGAGGIFGAQGGAAGLPGGNGRGGNGGGAATTSSGGSAGGSNAQAGLLGNGGNGADIGSLGGGGGGGGGLYGGGGGGGGDGQGGGGGGGGSSLVPTGGSTDLTDAAPAITISYTVPPTAGAIAATSGSGQVAQAGAVFAQPLVATVTDPSQANAAVSGVAVTFTVTSGSASFTGGSATATVNTDADGRATSPTLTAGDASGPVTVTATTPGVATPATFTETVTPALQAPTINTTRLPDAAVGESYDTTVTASGTAPITYTVSAGALPDGLDLDATTGQISGTPTTAARARFTITATNAAGSDDQNLTLRVAAGDGATPASQTTGGAAASGTLPNAGADASVTLAALLGVVLLSAGGLLLASTRRGRSLNRA